MKNIHAHRYFLFLFLTFLFAGNLIARDYFRAGTVLEEASNALSRGEYVQAVSLAESVMNNSAVLSNRLRAVDILIKSNVALSEIGNAEKAYRKGMELFQSDFDALGSNPLNDADYKRFVFNYGQFLLSTGRFDECLQLISDIDFPPGDEKIRLEGLKASAWMRKGEYGKSLEIIDGILQNNEAQEGVSANTLNTLHQNRGFIHLMNKDYSRAETDLRYAVNHTEEKNNAIARANLALALAYNGNFDEALSEIDRALAYIETRFGKSDRDYIIALRKKGEILHSAGRSKEASKVFNDFYNLERNRLERILPQLNPHERLNYWTMEKPLLSKCFLVAREDPALAMDVALTRREISLLGSGNNTERDARISLGKGSVAGKLLKNEAAVAFVTYKDFNDVLEYIAIILTADGKCRAVPIFSEELVYSTNNGFGSVYDALLSEDPADKNWLYKDINLGEAVWRPIIEVLPEDVNTIHFAPEGVFHLWGIENMPFNGKEKFDFIRHFSLFDLIDSSGKRSLKPSGNDMLLAGGLDYDQAVSFIDNGKDSTGRNNEAFMALSGNINRGPGEKLFQYLPGTAIEIDKIKLHVEGVGPVSYLPEDLLKKEMSGYRIVHLATHGYALDCGVDETLATTDSIGYDLSLIRSGLALTGANLGETGLEDGILSAREICDLDLGSVDLVVLSACQTAKGLITDESASGLIRALKNAGVKTIVATLWEVDDKSASMFMSFFYEALGKGENYRNAFEYARKATADYSVPIPYRKFNAASLAGRRTAPEETKYNKPYAAPWYWAPFILIDP